MRKILIIAIIASAAAFAASCTQASVDRAYATVVIGKCEVIRDGKNTEKLKVNDVVKNGDVVRTGGASFAVLQVGKDIAVRIQPDTTVKASFLFDTQKAEIVMSGGHVMSKVMKLPMGVGYSVNTPTTTAAVRGTVYGVSYYSGVSVVAVKDGKVHVSNLTKTSEKIVEAGGTAKVDGDVSARGLSELESLELEKAASLELVSSPGDLKERETRDLEEKFRKRDGEMDLKINDAMTKNPAAFGRDCVFNYGRMDVITLYSGLVIRGVIVSRGDFYQVLTPQGLVGIPAKKVRSTKVTK
ncbi:MAG: FecR family protein [Spirochaetes bacterium]|jgi:hypothetical protein|nr:FecR family protein [Spirochaetota bacterium]